MSEQDASDPEHAPDDEATDDTTADEGVESDPDDRETVDGKAGDEGTDDERAPLSEVSEADADELSTELVERVEETEAESVARELAALRVEVDALEAELDERESELDDATEQLKRKQAEFQNYKKRMDKRREQEKQRATEDLVERLVGVRDNLVRALDQEDADAEDIREGVETTLSQFDRVLDEENVDVVEPEPGEEVDPHTHEVLMRVDSDQPEDTIADVHRPGYVMADKVLQTAQVTVSDSGE